MLIFTIIFLNPSVLISLGFPSTVVTVFIFFRFSWLYLFYFSSIDNSFLNCSGCDSEINICIAFMHIHACTHAHFFFLSFEAGFHGGALPRPSWPRICYVGQVVLELKSSTISKVLGLKVYSTMPSHISILFRCMCVSGHTCHIECVEVRGQHSGGSFLLWPYWSQGIKFRFSSLVENECIYLLSHLACLNSIYMLIFIFH